MAGRYRALLIGNSTYPADEHNLQTLKGPVKDIAALDHALADPGTGLFADADVTLLAEATSTRATRALGRFFGTATRDDVLLIYFSGHGRLDQSGRLHLCMQDTDSTDLLSTAVSSARINEFADASRARNVVIVLDCCHAGAFRGGDLGQAVAGPGRYVLTSCRGTQLANDATVENGTSFFSQHLVDGLLQAAVDQDQDGYVTFSDLYAYVDRRLREAGKQIPQRRVDGDGDLPLARRPLSPPAEGTAAAQPAPGHTATTTGPGQPQEPGPGSPGSTVAGKDTVQETTSTPARSRTGWPRRRVMLAASAAAVLVVGGATTAMVLLSRGSGGSSVGNANVGSSPGAYVADGPWRVKIDDRISPNDNGCTVTLRDTHSGQQIPLPGGLYGTSMWQIQQRGSFRWQGNDRGCIVVTLAGPGTDKLPLAWAQFGDSDAFAAPPRMAVQVKDYKGSGSCRITLRDPTNGQPIDFKDATLGRDNDTVVLDAGGHSTAYLSDLGCAVLVSAAP